jgi:tetratricopeptide (TPR) repeat protein
MSNLAVVYENAGLPDKALALHEQVLQRRKAKLGPEHLDTADSTYYLGALCGRMGQFDRAVPLLVETLRLQKERLGPDHPYTLLTMSNLGGCYRETGRLPEATALLEEALDRARKLPGGVPATATLVLSALAFTYDETGQLAKAEPLHREYLQWMEKQSGPDTAQTAAALAGLGRNLLKRQRSADSEALLQRCLAIRAKKKPDDWTTFNTRSLLGDALMGQKKYAEAEPLLREGYDGMKQKRADALRGWSSGCKQHHPNHRSDFTERAARARSGEPDLQWRILQRPRRRSRSLQPRP